MSTDEHITRQLTPLIDGKRVLAVEGAVIPAPPHAPEPGEHLFVNCFYSADVFALPAQTMLATARADTLRIVRELVKAGLLVGLASVCVTCVPFPAPNIPRRRLYRFSRSTSLIPHEESAINESLFETNRSVKECIQSSEIEAIARLLHAEVQMPLRN